MGATGLVAVISGRKDPEKWFAQARKSARGSHGADPYSGGWNTFERVEVHSACLPSRGAAEELALSLSEKWSHCVAVRFREHGKPVQWLIAGWAAE